MRNVSDKHFRKNQNKLVMFNHFLPPPPAKSLTVCEIMLKNLVESDRPQMAILRMRFAYWITRTTHTHTHKICLSLSQYLILYCFSTGELVERKRSNLTFYIKCLCYFILFRVTDICTEELTVKLSQTSHSKTGHTTLVKCFRFVG